MAKTTLNLTEIKSGNNVGWYVASQAMNTATIKFLNENGKVLATAYKNNKSTDYQIIGQGNFDFTGKALHIEIDIPQSQQISQSIASSGITDNVANKVGHIYSFCFEDYTDADYNDFYINVCGWSKKG